MKLLKFLFIFTLCILYINCSKSETPTTISDPEIDKGEEDTEPTTPQEPIFETYFSLSVDESKDTSITDDWILIHDFNGNVLDFKSFETGDQFEFEDLNTNLTDQINISFFSFISTANSVLPYDQYTINTFNKIEKGSTWVYKEIEFPDYYSTSTGDFSVDIENVPSEFAGELNFIVSNARINSSYSSIFNNTRTIP